MMSPLYCITSSLLFFAFSMQAQDQSAPMKKSILEPHVGTIMDLYPKDEDAKTIVRILEEAFTEDRHGTRPGKWIDEIPATRPEPPPRLKPELTARELLHDAGKANAHWLAFQKRCPKTYAILKKYGYRPNITFMPGDDWEAYREKIFDWEEKISRLHKAHIKSTTEEKDMFFQGLVNLVVYLDFRLGHLSPENKAQTQFIANRINLAPPRVEAYGDEKDYPLLECAITEELAWPYVDIEEEKRDGKRCMMRLAAPFEQYDIKKEIQVCKWAFKEGIIKTKQEIMVPIISISNAYAKEKDYGALIVFWHAHYQDGGDQTQKLRMQRAFNERFGKNDGPEKYQQYIAAIEVLNYKNQSHYKE
jgi:hypothetical protein